MGKPLIIAHRGASKAAPEDSMSAIKKAVASGAGGIQLDVQLSYNGQPVLIHDSKIDRTSNGTGFVKDMTVEKLKEFDFGSWFSEEFRGEKILTLTEALEYLVEQDIRLYLEFKNTTEVYEGMEEKVLQILQDFRLVDRTIITSFNHYSVIKVKKLEPSMKVGILYGFGLAYPWEYAIRIQVDSIHTSWSNIDAEMIDRCRKNNILVNANTIDDMKIVKAVAALGVDGIMTNVPDIALQALI